MSERVYVTENGEKAWIEMNESAYKKITKWDWGQTMNENFVDFLKSAELHRDEDQADAAVAAAEAEAEEQAEAEAEDDEDEAEGQAEETDEAEAEAEA